MSSARGLIGPAAGRVSSGWDGAIASFAPLAEAARSGSAQAAKLDAKQGRNHKGHKSANKKEVSRLSFSTTETESSSHTGLYAMLATGVVVGAAGAFVARRRTRAKWAEYEPASLHSDASTFHNAGATSKTSMGGDGQSPAVDGTVTKATHWTMDHARSAVDSIRHRIHEATADHHSDGMADKADPGRPVDRKAEPKAEPKAEMKADTKITAKPVGSGGTRTNDRIEDEVDDLIRSAKNGHM
jgi:hypothetical protein